MSKVKIQGHASGTGVLTVTAPNTSTDRTITLPDGTGTLLTTDGDGSSLTGVGVDGISSSADATAITIDSSEKVNFNQGRLQLGHINKFIDTANYVGDAINIGSHPYANGTVIGQSYPADSPTTIKRTIHTTGTETKFFTVSGATETERVRIDQHGIKFNGDSAAANALDDYEEGTWTPVLGDSAGNNTWSGTATGKYIKVGKAVMCYFHKYTTGTNTNSSPAYIRGLPFISDGVYRFSIHGRGSGTTDSGSNWFTELYFANNTTELRLQDSNRKLGGGSGTTDIQLNNLRTDGTVTSSFWYQTD